MSPRVGLRPLLRLPWLALGPGTLGQRPWISEWEICACKDACHWQAGSRDPDNVSYSRPVILLRTVRRTAFSCFAAVALVSVTYAGPAHAQSDEQRSAARAAATEGLQALSEGRYKDALDLCTRAESLMHAP